MATRVKLLPVDPAGTLALSPRHIAIRKKARAVQLVCAAAHAVAALAMAPGVHHRDGAELLQRSDALARLAGQVDQVFPTDAAPPRKGVAR